MMAKNHVAAASNEALETDEVPQTDNKVAFVVHLLGGGYPESPVFRQDKEPILCGRGCDWCTFLLPAGQQLSQGMRLQHIA